MASVSYETDEGMFLFDQGKGSVRCKICGKEYQSEALKSFTLPLCQCE
jgi:hypothetical protein